jgi:CTP synthase
MQTAVIEFARNVAGIEGAHTLEHSENTAHPVIHLMAEQEDVEDKGGTMRLGAYDCVLEPDSLAARLYKTTRISERHRHRYEFNDAYADRLRASGMTLTGRHPELGLVEVVEIPDHPFFIGVQYHPEFKSRPLEAHPIFSGFVAAAKQHQGGGDASVLHPRAKVDA